MTLYRKLVLGCALFIFAFSSGAQEALKGATEEYCDILSLSGIGSRPTLGYRTLSDSVWNLTAATDNDTAARQHPWECNSLGTTQLINDNKNLSWKLFAPEWYNSYNAAMPYGQNDGALWQGKGYNTSLSAGARIAAYGVELTIKPQISFSQNADFTMLPSAYDSKYGYFWGYANNIGIDMPQRFGDRPFYTFDWGDTEIRYSWHSLTLGFGTQSPWIGPAWLNPILGGNNAGTYPKLDIGLRRQSVVVPFQNWYLGDIEARMWIGYLSESDYFDDNGSNNHNRLNGFTFSYAPSFLPGLTMGATKVCLSKWGDFQWNYLNPLYDGNTVDSAIGEDQKASVYLSWLLPKAGMEIYGEAGIDDYLQGGMIKGLMRYPFDSLLYTVGLKKAFVLSEEKNVSGELIVECSDMEEPRNRISAKEAYAFNMHYQVSQGYSNRGQAIGTALANGGNSQLIQFTLYYPKGSTSLSVQRTNPDDTYSYTRLSNLNNTYKSCCIVGLNDRYFLTRNLQVFGGVDINYIINPLYYQQNAAGDIIETGTLISPRMTLGLTYNFF
jgi:hypothetical protein